MTPVRLTRSAMALLPTLAPALAGGGLTLRDRPEAPLILTCEDDERATARDVILDPSPTTVPFLVSSRDGRPARIGFGFADMAFGHALVAALVRPATHPAWAEPATARLFAEAAMIAATRAPVLIGGESGTGKEGLARFIHEGSPRRTGPFVAVNCAALPEAMAEALLFGHERGAFTGAVASGEGLFRAADGGTLLLDEVAELAPALQAKLLRTLQEGEVLPVGAVRPVRVDVRIVAATNRDLAAEVAAGRFRDDLRWRLDVMSLALPPLRERRQDVRAISAAMLLRFAGEGTAFAWPTPEALDALAAHPWPGNARELGNVLQRAMLAAQGGRIDLSHLRLRAAATPAGFAAIGKRSQAAAIRAALAAADGHRARAAAALGISERTLRYRLAEGAMAA